jgi:hypothetical protein
MKYWPPDVKQHSDGYIQDLSTIHEPVSNCYTRLKKERKKLEKLQIYSVL